MQNGNIRVLCKIMVKRMEYMQYRELEIVLKGYNVMLIGFFDIGNYL